MTWNRSLLMELLTTRLAGQTRQLDLPQFVHFQHPIPMPEYKESLISTKLIHTSWKKKPEPETQTRCWFEIFGWTPPTPRQAVHPNTVGRRKDMFMSWRIPLLSFVVS